MPNVTITRRLRPLRLAFLLSPRDRDALRRVIEVNTCLWGGRFNAIVPYQRSGFSVASGRWTGDEIVRGYLDRFEPDFLIDLTGAAVGDRFFEKERLIKEVDVFDRDKHGRVGHGLSITSVVRHAYREEHRFVRRHKAEYVLPPVQGTPIDLLLSAAFGKYPDRPSSFLRNYRDVFEPDEEPVGPATLYAKLAVGTPSKITNFGVDVARPGAIGPAIFLLDGKRPADVIDFWNLRAAGCELLPFPLQWTDDLLATAREFILRQLTWFEQRPALRSPTMIFPARSIAAGAVDEFVARLGDEFRGRVTAQSWYPPLWDARVQSHDVVRCTLSAAEDEVERPVEGAKDRVFVTTSSLAPPFADHAFGADARWANVISVRSNAAVPVTPPVVPTPLHDPAKLFAGGWRGAVAVMGEGIVVYGGDGGRQILRLPSPSEVAHDWLRARGFTASKSAAGRVAESMIRALRGLHGVRTIAYRELVDRLDGLSHGVADRAPAEDAGGRRRRSQTRPRCDPYSEMFAMLQRLHGNNTEVAGRHLQNLLDAGVLRIGLQVQCPECTQKTWFSLEEIRDRLRCERCLEPFAFPAASPPAPQAWSYRTQGAFSIENFAHGSYAVTLALRLLAGDFFDRDFAWIPSTIIRRDGARELEFDFAVWRRDWSTSRVTTVFGEAKSFGEFGAKDFESARMLSGRFPGAYLAFVTLKERLTATETRRLRSLAREGRRPTEDGGWRTPVIVLTGRELFNDAQPPHCWRNAGATFARAAEICRPATDLLSLAQATQLAYLDLEPQEELLRAHQVMTGRDEALVRPGPRRRRSTGRTGTR